MPVVVSKVSAPSVDEPGRTVGRLIKQVFNSLVRGVDQRMQPLGLTAMQWEPMLLLYTGSVNTVNALARVSQVDPGAMTRMLDRLEEKQLLRRQRSDADRRVVNLELTAKGQKVAQDILPQVKEELALHLSDFTPAETSTLIQLLQRMALNGAQRAREEEQSPPTV